MKIEIKAVGFVIYAVALSEFRGLNNVPGVLYIGVHDPGLYLESTALASYYSPP